MILVIQLNYKSKMKARYLRRNLHFKTPAGTSRGILLEKETYLLIIENDGKTGVGECGILRGLSIDDRPDYETTLKWICEHISLGLDVLYPKLDAFPSIQFGLETALKSVQAENPFVIFPSLFTDGIHGISINGLVWMAQPQDMCTQINEKIKAGFSCIKLKIGALDFAVEYDLIKEIRAVHKPSDLEIRVDANGAYAPNEALEYLEALAPLGIHSIEQPIAAGNVAEMARLCKVTPVPIALDEELIGVSSAQKKLLIEQIKPQYIILKPSLIGGFRGTDEWISFAEQLGIKWWITSALESNIGLNAIAQYTYLKQNRLPQGLGTGALYTNNIASPLLVDHAQLFYSNTLQWDTSFIETE